MHEYTLKLREDKTSSDEPSAKQEPNDISIYRKSKQYNKSVQAQDCSCLVEALFGLLLLQMNLDQLILLFGPLPPLLSTVLHIPPSIFRFPEQNSLYGQILYFLYCLKFGDY
jgi:hypothetical protein